MSIRGRRGCDRMVVGFTTTCTISGYHHYSCDFEPRSWRGVLDTTLCATVCQWLAKGFSPGTPVSSTNKTNHHDITEMLLKVALNTIHLNVNTMIWTIYPYMFDLFESVSISELKWASYYPFGIFTVFPYAGLVCPRWIDGFWKQSTPYPGSNSIQYWEGVFWESL